MSQDEEGPINKLTLPMDIEGFGHYCGCEYCQDELLSAIEIAETGKGALNPDYKPEPEKAKAWRLILKATESEDI